MIAGRPSFSHVVDRVHTSSPTAAAQLARTRPVTYLVFDLLRLDGGGTRAGLVCGRRERGSNAATCPSVRARARIA